MNTETLYEVYKKHPMVCTDSRSIQAGCIFFALKGERFNGNTFAAQALNEGASFAVIDEPECKVDERTILVPDALKALQQLAYYHRMQFNIPFIAVCGSNGKTTSKELMHAVLSTTYKTIATPGNFNNHIGVPLTLLSIPKGTEMAIIEIGANHLHETYALCKIAAPDFGVVTNNGKDHLEGFCSIEGVRKANAELYQYLYEIGGTAFVNASLADLMEDSASLKRIIYGDDPKADFICHSYPHGIFAGLQFPDGKVAISRLAGTFNWINMALAAAVGHYFQVSQENIIQALETYQPRLNRSQMLNYRGATIIMDAYNANPSSMELALRSFMQIPGKKCVILGDMLELGEHAAAEHWAIVQLVKQLSPDEVVLVGTEFGQYKKEIQAHFFENSSDAAGWFKHQDFNGWHILLKGSRGLKLEKILE
ncbi:MAG: UDP-N-acetylmuramoyl-tripeptide--D-alanyl-D-alanine ligase [Flavobacteriales bacterium]|nr:UDP-N-acetylmuramoyl-tripeptide--D-alanyl-D-alanine ligase [Flavobacteriales bacterium]